jgi:aminopeptidase N
MLPVKAVLLAMLLGTPLAAQAVPDSLMVPGVSHELARYRAAQISNVKYDLALDVTRRDTVVGYARVSFTRNGAGDVILDFRGQALSDVKVNGTAADSAEYNGAHLRVPAALLSDGINAIEASFRSPIAPAGASVIRFTDETDKRDYLYTLLVPSDANLLFPCFDQPDLKALFTLELRIPSAWKALSNGRVVTEELAQPTKRVWFAETKPISTYLFAFAAGPYTQLRDSTNDITLWVRPSRAREVERETLITLNRRARGWLAAYFGVPYPFEKLDFLLAPAFPFGGMEHPGAIFYNEESFIFREPPTLNQQLGRQATVYHEVAHQWFGDYTTMKWFDDLWLKEGFATYMAAKMQAATEAGGAGAAWMSFFLRNKPTAYDVDASAGTTPVWQELANLDQAKSNYGAIVYNKAPGVLKQLNHLVGESAFGAGVHDFLTDHPYGNGTWQELIASIGSTSRRDLTDWGRAYFVRPGMPVLEQQLEIRGGRIERLALVQHPAQPAVSGPGVWPMKVDVRLHFDGTIPVTLPVNIVAETTVVAAAKGLFAPSFVYANVNDHGYGLFMLDDASRDWLLANGARLSAIGCRQVCDAEATFFHAMLWGSLWDLVREARVDPRRYVQTALAALPTERDEQITSRLLGRIGRALESYIFTAQAAAPNTEDAEVLRRVEELFLRAASDTSKSYGVRKNYFDSYVAVAKTPAAMQRLDAWLDSTAAAGMPLRQPTRWSIVTALYARGGLKAEMRLAAETARDTTTGGKRRAFIAGAASPNAETKRRYFDRYFADSTLNEDWVTASLGAFNVAEQSTLTLPYLRPALDTLSWVQKNRRIFFLGRWLDAFIGGQRSPEALAEVDRFLAEHPELPRDLRLKVLQTRDDLERTVRIRQAFAR